MAWIICQYCGKGFDNDYSIHRNSGECNLAIAARQMKALESIGKALENCHCNRCWELGER